MKLTSTQIRDLTTLFNKTYRQVVNDSLAKYGFKKYTNQMLEIERNSQHSWHFHFNPVMVIYLPNGYEIQLDFTTFNQGAKNMKEATDRVKSIDYVKQDLEAQLKEIKDDIKENN